jgi:hypothetical protein
MNMDTPVLISLIVAFVVAFFAWQWWTRRSAAGATGPRGALKGKRPVAAAEPKPTVADLAAPAAAPPQQAASENYPEVAGQSEADLRAKEPVQERRAPSSQQPVGHSGELGPLPVENNLRHPEQSFHQPALAQQQQRVPASDVQAGRAADASTPGMAGNIQQFTPEMAQNGGALIGNSVFAFDGMEPTGFAAF